MIAISKTIVVLFLLQAWVLSGATCLGQILSEEQQSSEAIEKATRLMLDYAQRRSQLPPRWAAIVRCDYQASPDAIRNTWYKSLSFIAKDAENDRSLVWRQHVAFQAIDDSWPSEWGAWKKGKEYVVRENGRWIDYQTSKKQSVNIIDPLNVFCTLGKDL
jgi:hypothetical protein